MESTNKFDVSVILPIKSGKSNGFTEYFEKCIESLKIQKMGFSELIIVHTPETYLVDYIKGFDFGDLNVRMISWDKEPNYSAQINHGAREAKSEWISFFEIDDEYSSIWFKNVDMYSKAYPDTQVFLPIVVDTDAQGKFAGFTNEATFAANFTPEMGILTNETLHDYQNFQTSGMVIKKSAFLDFGLFNNRITGSVDVYKNKTSDLLNLIGQPAGANFSNQVVANVGDMENKGLELNLNGQVVRNSNFTWDLGVNATVNKNTITNLTIAPDPNYPGNKFGGISGGVGNTILINSVGFNRGAFYVYQQVYDAAGKPIEGLLADRNGDGTINDKDLYQYKSADPKVFLGLTSNFTYKKWNAGFILRASIGNYMYNNVYSGMGRYNAISSLPTYLGNASINYLDTKFNGITGGVNQLQSDYYVQNASFLKMDNLNVGYNVGKVLGNTASLRVNASVQNVFTITKYKGLDPEIGGGIDNNFYPRPRVYSVNLTFDF